MFIFDTLASIMLGIFYANSPVSLNLEPKAFAQLSGLDQREHPPIESPLPVQLQFRFALDCPPIQIPIHDQELQYALGEYITNMGQIGVEETKLLANLFARRAFAAFPMLLGGKRNMPVISLEKNSLGRYYRPYFRHVEVVPINITGDPYELRRRILGMSASNIKNIYANIGPNSQDQVRFRLRGIGSGFVEGPNHCELQEPLHFNVCAENPALLETAVRLLKEMLQKVEIVGRQF